MDYRKDIVLDNGVEIPRIGLGTYLSTPGEETYRAVRYGLETGYRHIDTAAFYQNEADVGKAVRDSGMDQNDIFVTTKVWNRDQGYDSTLRAFDKSLKNLGLEQVDLYLIHWPQSGTRQDTWKALVNIYENGLARSIGVSNYTSRHIEELCDATSIVPAVNQVEMSPYLNQAELMETCRRNRVRIEAYTPLIRGRKFGEPRLVAMAEKYGVTEAQILIRWCLQKDVIVLPKSVNPARIKENFEVFGFDISDEDMQSMESWNEDYRVAWDPTDVE